MDNESHHVQCDRMNKLSASFPRIRIWGDGNYGSGANNALRGLLQALKHLGLGPEKVHVAIASTSSGIYQEQGEHDWFHDYVYQPNSGDDQINLCCLHPSHLAGKHTAAGGRYNIAYCPWETSKLPAVFVAELNRYDEVWAPVNFVKDTFTKSGVTVPIYVVPHPLQQELLDRPLRSADQNTDKVGFYFIGSLNPRKNVEALLRAWFQTIEDGWSPATPVSLTLHLVPSARDLDAVERHQWIVKRTIESFVGALPANLRTSIPGFRVLCTPKPYRSMIELHEANHVFVTASRGEGFGLCAAEAAALGNLIVASPWAAPFFDDLFLQQRAPAPFPYVRLDTVEMPITPMPEVQGYELDQTWWEPYVKGVFKLTRDVCSVMLAETRTAVADIRRVLFPATVAEVAILPRLEAAGEVLAKSGW